MGPDAFSTIDESYHPTDQKVANYVINQRWMTGRSEPLPLARGLSESDNLGRVIYSIRYGLTLGRLNSVAGE